MGDRLGKSGNAKQHADKKETGLFHWLGCILSGSTEELVNDVQAVVTLEIHALLFAGEADDV